MSPAAAQLSDEHLARYDRDGFLAPLQVLDQQQVRQLQACVDRICGDLQGVEGQLYEVERAHLQRPDEVVTHFLGGWLVEPLLEELISLPSVTAPLATLLEVEELRLWHDQVFSKPARHPGHVPWHQDYSYWTRATPARHITIHIALDDTSEDNGCLHMVPGSHRWGLLPSVPFDAPMDALLDHISPRQRAEFQPVAVRLRAGEASVHHSHVVHGSYQNRSDGPRRSLVINYMHPDTRSADGTSPLLRGVPLIPEGAVIEGRHFPLVACAPERGADA